MISPPRELQANSHAESRLAWDHAHPERVDNFSTSHYIALRLFSPNSSSRYRTIFTRAMTVGENCSISAFIGLGDSSRERHTHPHSTHWQLYSAPQFWEVAQASPPWPVVQPNNCWPCSTTGPPKSPYDRQNTFYIQLRASPRRLLLHRRSECRIRRRRRCSDGRHSGDVGVVLLAVGEYFVHMCLGPVLDATHHVVSERPSSVSS